MGFKYHSIRPLFLLLFPLLPLVSGCQKDCVEKECNGYHTNRWDPVCGCNDKTYQNAEWAECHGIDDYSDGECEED